MYAVIASGGKQEKVAEGQQVRVELLDAEDGSDVSLTPVMVVDGSTVFATPDELKGATVTGKVIGRTKGPEDQRVHLQEAHQPAPSLRTSPELPRGRDHLDQHLRSQRHVKDQRWRFDPQRS